jgi:two-component system cell cycle response regulator DivK
MKLFNDLLEAHGYMTLQAKDGLEALQVARLHRPDLILMDIQLPGMDGVAALSQLRSDPVTAKIPVIALTAFAMQSERQRFRSAGFDGYLVKPINIRELLTAVGECCAQSTSHRGPLPEGGGGGDASP